MNHPIWKIIAKNTFTLFNFVNLILAIMVASVGSFKNMLFVTIALANTLISIINEIRAKKIVDKLRLISEQRPTVIRNGKSYQITKEEIKKGDRVILSLGDQIMFDSVVKNGTIEVNESFISGEQDNIEKHPGDQLTSGSFVVSGTAEAEVEHIGADNFVTKLTKEATTIKTADSKLFKLMNNIVKYGQPGTRVQGQADLRIGRPNAVPGDGYLENKSGIGVDVIIERTLDQRGIAILV